jgi:hypothetical protein
MGRDDATKGRMLGGFVDSLVQMFENCRPGLTDQILREGHEGVERFFVELYEKERPRLAETVQQQERHLSAEDRRELVERINERIRKVVIPAYVRLAGRFTPRERNDFYLAPEPLHGLERLGWTVAGMGIGAFVVWAPFIPLWQNEVGVRTSLFGVIEKRGAQQVYEPGGIYFFLPLVNAWNTLPISQQNLLMNANTSEGDRPVPDDITFKTKDGNNIYMDVNVMWRIDPKKAGNLVSQVGQSPREITERVVRPISRSVIRDVFNEITSEEYYQVSVKNRVAAKAKDQLAAEPRPWASSEATPT